MSNYLLAGIGGSVVYAMFSGTLIRSVFPPPFDPYFSSGRGLDLRGAGFVMGGLIGGYSGAATALVTYATSRTIAWVQLGRPKYAYRKP